MRITIIKIIVIIGILLASTLISVAIKGDNTNSRTPLFIVAGTIAVIGAVWKFKPHIHDLKA